MGGMETVIPAALQAVSTVAQHQQQRQSVKAQNEMLAQQQHQREKQQRDLLARQMATARARLSAGGAGLSGGSGVALLTGLSREAEEDIADSATLTRMRQDSNSSGSGLQQGLQLAQGGWGVFNKLQNL